MMASQATASSSEWAWVPEYQLYYSATRNLYAKTSSDGGQWEYLPPSRVVSSSGGIGDVGWDLRLGEAQDATTTAGRKDASSSAKASAPAQPQAIRVLRLVKLSSEVLPNGQTVAILDDRSDGYLIGRDRVPHAPMIRLKEMEVSKTHARIFFWNERQDVGVDDGWELVTDENFRGEGFYVVDVGSTHGTYLAEPSKKSDKRLSTSRHSSKPRMLQHLSRILIGTSLFEVHLHADWPCPACAVDSNKSNLIPTDPDAGSRSATSPAPSETYGQAARKIAMTADERRNDQRSRSSVAMKQLRESYFGPSDKQKKKQLAREAYNQAKAEVASEDTRPKAAAPTSNVSQSSLFELKGMVLEHRDKFAKEGRLAVKGHVKDHSRELSRDKFSRPSPGIARRMALEAKNEMKERRFNDANRVSEEQRMEIMRIKAQKYDALRRGEYGALTDKELAECAIDFERKWEDGNWSDHESDVDESVQVARADVSADGRSFCSVADPPIVKDDDVEVEYTDELGRTRTGTRREAREAETARRREQGSSAGPVPGFKSAHEDVMQSNVIYGPQSFFPVYEPSKEDLIERIKAAESETTATHYDASKETRARGAGAYQFSQDEDERARQMEELKRARDETEQKRAQTAQAELTPAQQAAKRKLDERRALIEAKRQKVLGGKDAVEAAREKAQEKQAEAFLSGIQLDDH